MFACNERIIGDPEFSNLPRKYKMSIAGCRHQCAVHEANDVGFVGNELDDIKQIEFMKQVVTQGALDSGRLRPDMLDPGVVSNGRVLNGSQFQTWFETKGANLVLSPPDSYIPNHPNNALSLENYVDRLVTSLELNK